jgi:hypothetical protein
MSAAAAAAAPTTKRELCTRSRTCRCSGCRDKHPLDSIHWKDPVTTTQDSSAADSSCSKDESIASKPECTKSLYCQCSVCFKHEANKQHPPVSQTSEDDDDDDDDDDDEDDEDDAADELEQKDNATTTGTTDESKEKQTPPAPLDLKPAVIRAALYVPTIRSDFEGGPIIKQVSDKQSILYLGPHNDHVCHNAVLMWENHCVKGHLFFLEAQTSHEMFHRGGIVFDPEDFIDKSEFHLWVEWIHNTTDNSEEIALRGNNTQIVHMLKTAIKYAFETKCKQLLRALYVRVHENARLISTHYKPGAQHRVRLDLMAAAAKCGKKVNYVYDPTVYTTDMPPGELTAEQCCELGELDPRFFDVAAYLFAACGMDSREIVQKKHLEVILGCLMSQMHVRITQAGSGERDFTETVAECL